MLFMGVWPLLLQLADVKWGVIGIRYRRVDCGHQPHKWAWADSTGKGVFPPHWQAQERKDNLDW
jgi:hypothetical protein